MVKCNELYNQILINVENTESYSKIKDVVWKSCKDLKLQYRKSLLKLKIILINTPCHGFGDIIFATKIHDYLKKWYNVDVKIATTEPEKFIKLGYPKNSLYLLKNAKGTANSCRRLKRLTLTTLGRKQIKLKADLYLVTPMQSDQDPDISDIQTVFSDATKFNTYYFSEYNPYNPQYYDFPMGIGKNLYGLLLTNFRKMRQDLIKHPYALSYIADSSSIPRAENCLISFIQLVTHKYNYPIFEIIVPSWVTDLSKRYWNKIINNIAKKYGKVYLYTKSDKMLLQNQPGLTLVLRSDIYPLQNKKMVSLIQNSVKDILVTGDQSITDVLSCCPNKNIFYQIAGWKESFAKQLSIELPNKFLTKKKTSCGTLSAIKYKSNYINFIKKWDFRKNAKQKLDCVLLSQICMKKSPKLRELIMKINSIHRLSSIKKQLLQV